MIAPRTPFLSVSYRSTFDKDDIWSPKNRSYSGMSREKPPKLPGVKELLTSPSPPAHYAHPHSPAQYSGGRSRTFSSGNSPQSREARPSNYPQPYPHLNNPTVNYNAPIPPLQGSRYSASPSPHHSLPPVSAIVPPTQYPTPPSTSTMASAAPPMLQTDPRNVPSPSSSTDKGRSVPRPVRKMVGERVVPGEGVCFIYDDGSHVRKEIDGELVNAEWGITKAGRPRKRLAIACKTCRDKKIKCEPAEPKCVQCEKSGRDCHFETARGPRR